MIARPTAEAVGSDTDALLDAFVAEHYDRLLRLARLICGNAADAADAVQAGLEQAWRGRRNLRDQARVGSWLDRIVAREAVRVSRRRNSWLGRLVSPRGEVKWIEPADRRLPEPSDFAALRHAFGKISPEQRAVVALHMHYGYSIGETAVLVGAPEETVRSRLRLARQRLRRELEEAER